MGKRINAEIRKLILEICLVVVFTLVSIPLWDYLDNSSVATIAEHYSDLEESNVVVTNRKKYVYSETFEEAINERNSALITSYESNTDNYNVYLKLELGTNYDNLSYSDGKNIYKLSDLYESTSDYIYFKVGNKDINPNETLTYYYYIWTKNLKNDKNIKIKFAVL